MNMSPPPSPIPGGPAPIRRLQQSVINRIAAGEIIHRPASALKELIENSLDASSTQIRITVKDGGMKLLQIQDNGCGIRKSDLPILAERFTTSKLSTFSDLKRLTTYGFRGEALASMSYVAHLSVVTKTKQDSCAWKACYADGVLAPAKAGTSLDPKPCAGNDGTTITVENLFYSTPTRLSALRGSSEEYARILDVVTKYAIHNPHVSFSCKKAGSPTPDISTSSSSSIKIVIGQLYGQTIAKDLLYVKVSPATSGTARINDKEVECEDKSDEMDDLSTEEATSWSAEAHITNANYQAKKMVLLLFINNRLVESPRIKKALEAIYVGILPRGMSPFIYLSLQLDPSTVDVNVHPTKREVHFLDEDVVMERIADVLQRALVGQSHSRVYEYQTLLTGGIQEAQSNANNQGKGKRKERADEDADVMDVDEMPSSSKASPIKKTLSQHKVRTSMNDRTLDSMFPVHNPSQLKESVDSSESAPSGAQTTPGRQRSEIKESECFLTSVVNLRQAVLKRKHNQLSEIIQKHVFVGIVDLDRCLSLIQHSTKLYLINYASLSEELFYQLGLRQFGNFGRMKLEPPPPLRTLVSLAVDAEESIIRSSMNKPQIVDRIVETLISRREMLTEYFSLTISAEGLVQSLPLLLRDYTPNLDKLPLFLMRLGPQVKWTSEIECFETFLRELAYFYVPEPLSVDTSSELTEERKAEDKAVRWQIEHILFPAMTRYLVPPQSLLERDVVQVANLPDLYRVFERC